MEVGRESYIAQVISRWCELFSFKKFTNGIYCYQLLSCDDN